MNSFSQANTLCLSPEEPVVPGYKALLPIAAASSGDNAAAGGVYAVDGKLSLSIRPTGWTLGVFGPSIRNLGAGTGGQVSLHCNPITRQIVAIKTLACAKNRGSEEVPPPPPCAQQSRRMLMEMGIAMNVQHENVIRTLQVIAEPDSRCYLVQEACTIDLFTLVQRGQAAHGGGMTESEIGGYFRQLVCGV
ncbi:hypothetical protein GGI21_006539, partial [Coemansia aciculifera]